MKITFWVAVLILAVLFVLNYQSKIVDTRPIFLDEGKVFVTLYAEAYGDKSVLIAVEANKEKLSNVVEFQQAFTSFRNDWPGYPPKRFKIRFGKVYPMEWSNTWGNQR
jgi:hypothetical protein